MKLRKQTLIPLIFVCLGSMIATACGTSSGQGSSVLAPQATKPIDVSSLEVIDRRIIKMEGKELLGLSPDGQWLAVYDESGLCIYDVNTLAEKVCARKREPITSLSPTIAWAPDSNYLAMTEDFTRLLVDGDIWVMAVDTGELQNLTDDGFDGDLLKATFDGSRIPSADYCPTWSYDAKSIVFYRFEKDAKGTRTLIARVPASGGRVNETASLEFDQGRNPICLLLLSKDDRTAIFHDTGREGRGIWQVNQGRLTRVAEYDLKQGMPWRMALLDDDRKLAVVYLNPVLPFGRLEVIDLHSTETVFSVESPIPKVRDVASSPDGSAIVWLELAEDSFHGLVVSDVTWQHEIAFSLGPDEEDGDSIAVLNRVQWANNNTIFAFIEGKRGEGVLLTLAVD